MCTVSFLNYCRYYPFIYHRLHHLHLQSERILQKHRASTRGVRILFEDGEFNIIPNTVLVCIHTRNTRVRITWRRRQILPEYIIERELRRVNLRDFLTGLVFPAQHKPAIDDEQEICAQNNYHSPLQDFLKHKKIVSLSRTFLMHRVSSSAHREERAARPSCPRPS